MDESDSAPSAVIRADGDGAIGAGHVMRMAALAQAIVADGGRATLACVKLSERLEQRVRGLGVALRRGQAEPGSEEDRRWLSELAQQGQADWVLTDGYAFRDAYHDALVQAGHHTLVVADYDHCERYPVDLVLNQNLSASPELYARRAQHTRLLLGPGFALLRPEFTEREPALPSEQPSQARRLLVTMGAADPPNSTGLILQALSRCSDPELSARIVVGPANPHWQALQPLARDPRLRLMRGADDMAGLMQWAQLAIAGAGSTTYELCFMGVPSMLVMLADNQRPVCARTVEAGAAVELGWHGQLQVPVLADSIESLCVDPARRDALVRAGRKLVDGRGAARVIEAMRTVQTAATAGSPSG